MLASTQPPTAGADWAFEPKLDGWRALIYVDDAVMVRTRTDWKRGHAPRRHR